MVNHYEGAVGVLSIAKAYYSTFTNSSIWFYFDFARAFFMTINIGFGTIHRRAD